MINKEMMLVIKNNPKLSEILDLYMTNEMKKLKNICYKIWKGKVDNYEEDELLDDAIEVLIESLVTYDTKSKAKFETYLTGNISRSSYSWFRDNKYTGCRNNLARDGNGKIIYEEINGKKRPIRIDSVSFDMDNDETQNLKETLSSKINIDDILIAEEYTDKVELYLSNLPKRVRGVAKLFSQEYNRDEIMELLHITEQQLLDCMKILRSYEYISLLFD